MPNLIKIRGYYHYNRRVPEIFCDYDYRNSIRINLKTKRKSEATHSAKELNHRIEAYWHSLVANNARYDPHSFKETIKEARLFPQKREVPSINNDKSITVTELRDLLFQVLIGNGESIGVNIPKQTTKKLKSALELYWQISRNKILHKSEKQIIKWKNPQQRAIQNLIKVCGNKPIADITRDDLMAFQAWWMRRIKKGLSPNTANKDIIYLKIVIDTVSDYLGYNIDTPHLFRRMCFKSIVKQRRLPFSKSEILAILHFLKNQEDLIPYSIVSVLAETGARPSEIFGLLQEDIHLDAETPYISITDRKERELKTIYSRRDIPLVGYALSAFQCFPHGFKKYRNQVDKIGTQINRVLRKNSLFPSENHSLYSLRHSFQDRILSVNMPDRIQADLMGHKFNRPCYGSGPTIEQKLEWMKKICLENISDKA